jgi:hypothetical protein
MTTKEVLLARNIGYNGVCLITMATEMYPQTDNQSNFIICEIEVMIQETKKQLLLESH